MVEVDLLVRAAGDALAPAAAAVLVDQHDAVLGALVDRARRAGRHAGRVEAVLADPGQVEHERLLELELDLVLGLAPDPLDDRVEVSHLGGAREVVVPVGRPRDLRVLAGDERLRAGHREVVAQRRLDEGLVVVGPRLVVVAELGLDRAGEDRQQALEASAGPELQATPLVELPAALPLLLVLVAARVALPGSGLDVVEPDVLGPGPVGPRLLAGDRAGLAADALVEVHHHAHLGHDAVSAPSVVEEGALAPVTTHQ